MEISAIFDSRYQIRRLRLILLVFTFVIAFYSYSSYANRVSEKIYAPLQSEHYCSRRLNATHQMGCSSELGGNFGVLWVVEEQADLEHVLKTGPTPPYIVVLRREHYTRKNLLEFKSNTDRVAGVVFLDENHADSKLRSIPFSPEDRCPNQYAGLYANDTNYGHCKQNFWQRESAISGLLYDDIPYPIFLMNEQKSIEQLESCFANNNIAKGSHKNQASYPLCSMQLDSFMLAAKDTRTCLNSHSLVDDILQSNGQRCNTVENHNIFAFYKPAYGPAHLSKEGSKLMIPDMVEPQSVVMLIAKLSSLSMFTEISPGADSTIVPIVTQLAIAEALSKVRNNKEVVKSSRNIAFAFLDSEPFDYTGSSRIVYDMQNDSFPNMNFWASGQNITDTIKNINLISLDYVINLDQLANYPNSSTIYLHSDPNDAGNKKLAHLVEVLKRTASGEKVQFEHEDPQLPLPPGPVHEFIKRSQLTLPKDKLFGAVLSNYGKTYNNLFYNSIYDDSHNIFQTSKEKLVEHISRVASLVAKSAYELAFAGKTDDIIVDKGLIEDLLECYMIDAECNLFTRAWRAGHKLPSGPILTYKDPTKQSDDMNGAITTNLLAYFLGDRISEYNLTKCKEENRWSLIYNYLYVNGKNEPVKDGNSGVCIRSQVLKVSSTSPSFEVTSDSILVNENYPAWTVSLNSIRNPVRLFLKSSPVYQWCIFLLGIVVTLMSFITVSQIKATISRLEMESATQPGTST